MKQKNKLVDSIVEGIQEKKGKHITILDMTQIAGAVCEYFVLCDGNTPSQVSAIAESVEAFVKKKTGESPIRVQGMQLAEWVGIDYGNIMVHVFVPDLRKFYNLDMLWADAHVKEIADLD